MVDHCDDAIGISAKVVEDHYKFMLACADGKDSEANDPEVGVIIWGWEFVATDDDRTCDLCRQCNGVRLPKGHMFWKYGRPPIRRGCRCDREVITIFDVERGEAVQTSENFVPKDWSKG